MSAEQAPWPALVPFLDVLERLHVRHHVGGSVASSLLSVSRATQDVDLVADLEGDDVGPLVEALGPEWYADEELIRAAVHRRGSFNVLHLPTMFKIDVFVAARDPLSRSELDRAIPVEVPGLARMLRVSAPENLVLRKLEWYRKGGEVSARQLEDVVTLLRFLGSSIDGSYLDQWAGALGVEDLLARVRSRAG